MVKIVIRQYKMPGNNIYMYQYKCIVYFEDVKSETSKGLLVSCYEC